MGQKKSGSGSLSVQPGNGIRCFAARGDGRRKPKLAGDANLGSKGFVKQRHRRILASRLASRLICEGLQLCAEGAVLQGDAVFPSPQCTSMDQRINLPRLWHIRRTSRKRLAMTNTRVFKNGNSQAVRIPADLAYDRMDIDLEIERIGDEIRIRPARRSLAGVLAKFARFSPEFLGEGRGDQEQAERDSL